MNKFCKIVGYEKRESMENFMIKTFPFEQFPIDILKKIIIYCEPGAFIWLLIENRQVGEKVKDNKEIIHAKHEHDIGTSFTPKLYDYIDNILELQKCIKEDSFNVLNYPGVLNLWKAYGYCSKINMDKKSYINIKELCDNFFNTRQDYSISGRQYDNVESENSRLIIYLSQYHLDINIKNALLKGFPINQMLMVKRMDIFNIDVIQFLLKNIRMSS